VKGKAHRSSRKKKKPPLGIHLRLWWMGWEKRYVTSASVAFRCGGAGLVNSRDETLDGDGE